jgi:lipopolysaccharide/colanic/teichoic acid biosynthesis glycosyltransferase
MARNYVRASEDSAGQVMHQVARQMSWRGLVYWSAAVLLALLAWLRVRYIAFENPPAAWGGAFSLLALAFLHAILTLVIARSLAFIPLNLSWRFRLAFLTSASLTLVHWILLVALVPLVVDFPMLAVEIGVAVLGAFVGGLIATGIELKFWEDNSPPSQSVEKDVLLCHQKMIAGELPVPIAKRVFDISLALAGLVLSSPLWVVSTFVLWIEDPGPILFVKNSVGKGGGNFHQFKFRTMVRGAENHTGPVLAQEDDQRVLAFGRFLRTSALDELPQLINILIGEMSFVGPRPQRTVLVQEYLHSIPEYAERHRVLPGLAGLAQVAGDYYLTPRQKLRFDRLYIRYSSLSFDLKLILLACSIAFWFRWQKDWRGRLPRRLLRWGSKAAKNA